jgi:hypothetical protein
VVMFPLFTFAVPRSATSYRCSLHFGLRLRTSALARVQLSLEVA